MMHSFSFANNQQSYQKEGGDSVVTTESPPFFMRIRCKLLYFILLFLALCGDEVAVHAADVLKLDVLGTFSCAGTGVGAVAEPEFIHLRNHGAYATVFLHFSLGKERELAHLG